MQPNGVAVWQGDGRARLPWNRSGEPKFPWCAEISLSVSSDTNQEVSGLLRLFACLCKMKMFVSWWLPLSSDVHTAFDIRWWQCQGQSFWELARVRALGSGWLSITRDRSGPLLVVLWFLVVHTWDLCARIFKKRLMVFEGWSEVVVSLILGFFSVQKELIPWTFDIGHMATISLRNFSLSKIIHAGFLKQNKSFIKAHSV